MSIIDRLMNRAPRFERNELNEIDVRFHKEANHHTIHGYLVVTHRQLGIREGAVAFSFPNFSDAPDLDLRLMLDLFEAAKSQGFIPHRLAAYGALQPMPEAHGATPAVPTAAPATTWTRDNSTFEGVDRRLQSVPAIARKQAAVAQNQRSTQGLKEISELHGLYATRLAALGEDERAQVEIAIEQVMSNGRSMKYDNATLLKKVQEAYGRAFPITSFSGDEAAALQLHFGRVGNDALRTLGGGEAGSH